MKEYIDKTALMKKVHTGMNTIEVMQAIIDAPAADVVEVVRCSDCEHWDRDNEARLDKGCYCCSCFGGYTRSTFYCAVGERKGGNE